MLMLNNKCMARLQHVNVCLLRCMLQIVSEECAKAVDTADKLQHLLNAGAPLDQTTGLLVLHWLLAWTCYRYQLSRCNFTYKLHQLASWSELCAAAAKDCEHHKMIAELREDIKMCEQTRSEQQQAASAREKAKNDLQALLDDAQERIAKLQVDVDAKIHLQVCYVCLC